MSKLLRAWTKPNLGLLNLYFYPFTGYPFTGERTWSDKKKIKVIRLPDSDRRMYCMSSVEQYLGVTEGNRFDAIYARVSSSHQKDDLQRQVLELQESYPEFRLFKDVGSGLIPFGIPTGDNYKRKQFQALLEQVYQGNIRTLVVMFKDRLCRFGIELLEQIFKKFNTKLVVHGSGESIPTENDELRDDLLAVTTFFVARHNGRRSAIIPKGIPFRDNRKRRKTQNSRCGSQIPEKKKKKFDSEGTVNEEETKEC
jgi:predicted site-specific integrase-resolvase